jgi:hypothetical protein
MLLHDFKNEDGIKSFFTEIYELFIKVCYLALWPTDNSGSAFDHSTSCHNAADRTQSILRSRRNHHIGCI